MKNIFFSVFVLLVIVSSSNAQYYYDRSKNPDKPIVEKSGRDFDSFYFFSWDNNNPLSNQNYISQSSSLGTRLGYRKRLNDVDKLWVGADFGWVVYKQYVPYRTYQYGTQSISTETYNYSYNFSLTATLDYFFTPMENLITPYAGLGIGIAYDKFSQYYNIYGVTTNSYGLQVRPEVGVLVGFKKNSSWRIKAAVHYDYASNNGKLVDNNFITPGDDNYKGFVNMGFQVGIVKMAW
jgi:outer membrane protein W